MGIIGTVVRITSGNKRERYLIVVPGTVDVNDAGAVSRAMKSQRSYRIVTYPSGIKPGHQIPFTDKGTKKGRYWVAEFEGEITPKYKPPELTELEREMIRLPSPPKSLRENMISGLEILVNEIKNNWLFKWDESDGNASVYWYNPNSEQDIVVSHIQPYVEVMGGPVAAYEGYNALLTILKGEGKLYPRRDIGQADVDSARSELVREMAKIDSDALDRLKSWVKHHKKIIRREKK